MSKVQAEAGWPVVFHSRQIEEEKTAFALAVEVAEHFSPRVEAIASPLNGYAGRPPAIAVVLLIDSSGTGTLFGSTLRAMPKGSTGSFTTAGFSAGIGAAPNAEAALMLAQKQPRRSSVR